VLTVLPHGADWPIHAMRFYPCGDEDNLGNHSGDVKQCHFGEEKIECLIVECTEAKKLFTTQERESNPPEVPIVAQT
jgi:hypothetical protein